MAKNFHKAGSTNTFGAVAKAEQEKAQVIALQNINTENLVDNPDNGEVITMTSDLEESMKQNGFTDPMEVTDFGMENGKYMILSGHRRRAAGVKVGITVFPCVVRHFNNKQEVQNYTLMANSQRDSAKDPCLFCTRYKLHEQYLESINFKGNKREEIAKRLGISIQQADRYNAMNRVILPVWDMVRAEIVGMSSVQPMAKHTEEEQKEIYNIMQEARTAGASLTRDVMKQIVDGYRDGKRTWAEIADLPRDSGLPMNGLMNTEPGETKEETETNRNDEVRHDFDPIASEYDKMDADREAWEKEQAENAETTEVEDETDISDEISDMEEKEEKNVDPEEKACKLGEDILRQLHKLDTSLSDVYKCRDKEKAMELFNNMKSVSLILVDEMFNVANEYEMEKEFDSSMEAVKRATEQYKK